MQQNPNFPGPKSQRKIGAIALRALAVTMALGALLFAVTAQRSQGALGFGSSPDQSGRFEYADLADSVLPSVVTVYVKESVKHQIEEEQNRRNRLRSLFNNPDFRQLLPLLTPDGQAPDDNAPGGPATPAVPGAPAAPDLYGFGSQFMPTSSGSGIIVSSDGYILTNHHVLTQGDVAAQKALNPETMQVTVVLNDGTEIAGKDVKIIYSHPLADLALIKINKTGLKPIKWGDSEKLRVGERVAAVGSPLDLKATITQGIICAKNRDIDTMSHLIQTDAVINPGSSGGALVNLDGELIGINRLITSNTGRWQGFGFAIPSNDAKWFADEVIKNGEVTFGYLGVSMYPDGPDKMRVLATSNMEPDKPGVLIAGLKDDDPKLPNPSRKAGLEVGDLIIEVDGHKIADNSALQDYVKRQPVGKTIDVKVMRLDDQMKPQEKTFKVTLARRPDELSLNKPQGGQGDDSKAAPEEKAPDNSAQMGLKLEPAAKGLKVLSVDPGSPADDAGLKAGDIIYELNRKPVKSLDDLKPAIAARLNGHAHLLKFYRDGNAQIVPVAPPDEKPAAK